MTTSTLPGLMTYAEIEKTIREKLKKKKVKASKQSKDISVNERRDPIDVLMDEHEDVMKKLAMLNNAVDSIRVNGFSAEAFSQIAEAIRSIDKKVRDHNRKEEEHLFPLMDLHVTGAPLIMRNDHRDMWNAFKRLLSCVQDIEEGQLHGLSIIELVEVSKLIVDMLTNHIAKENTILFPMARRMLTQEEYARLREEITEVHG